MSRTKTVREMFSTRRTCCASAGLGLLGASVEGAWPLHAAATKPRFHPRGNARNVLFFEISGAVSHTESFDFKKTKDRLDDLDVRRINSDLSLPHLLFPRLEKHLDKIAILRSMLSHEEVHFRAQYYVQTGRQMNLAFAREIPALGSVISMELEPQRRPNDTFPIYMSFNLEKGLPGRYRQGFFHPGSQWLTSTLRPSRQEWRSTRKPSICSRSAGLC